MAQNREEKTPEKTPEELEELRRRTDETMANARKDVDRAVETSHDQILPAARGIDVEDFEEEGVADKEDTRGAWPNWSDDEHDTVQDAEHEAEHDTKHDTNHDTNHDTERD